MSFSQAEQEEIEKAQVRAKELLELFKGWVVKRKATVNQLRVIAEELRYVSTNVTAGKWVGTTAAVAGGVATVAGVGATIMTGGLAAPLIGWGIAGSVAGAVTRSVSEGIGQHLSKTKMEKAQKIMDEEAKHSKEIEEKKAELDKTVERLGKLLKLDRDQVLGMLFMANLLADMGILPNRLAADTAKLFLYSGSTVFLISGIALETMGQEMTKLIMKVSVQNILEIVGAVLQGMALGAAAVVLAWEIYQWVNVTADLVKGTSEAAEALEKVADELEKQMKEIEDWLNKLQEQAIEFEQTINKRFRGLLKDISDDGYAIQDEKNKVWQYVQHYADAKWKDTYVHHLDYDNFTFHLARVFTILYKQFKAHRGKQEDDDRKHITITVISHGGIDVDTNIPCSFYYMNDAMKRVTLYEPWGCAIDASVVYGITTNTIQIPHVRYSGRVRPSEPNTWNNLPRCTSPTPNITLTPVKIGEPAYRRLCRLFQVLQGKSDGLVIPYFTGEDQDLLPFPAIPFWVMCCVFALIAAMTRTEVKVRLAACLTVDNVFKVTGHVPCSQYCTVNGSRQPPVMMTSNLALPEELRARLESKLDLLDQYL